jgi:PBSX family phage terminase large subunit
MPVADITEFGPRQLEYLKTAHAPINLAYGAVASGKNLVEAARLAVYLAFQPLGYADKPFIFGGSSVKSIKRIVLNDLFEVVGPENYTYSEQTGSGRIYNRDFYSFGAAKANSHEPMRGINAAGAMVTEATLQHKNFMDELQLRVRMPGSMQFYDTNPAGPNHYIKTDYIENKELSKPLSPEVQKLYPKAQSLLHVYHFLMKDNPWIMQNPGYLEKLLAMYPPGTVLFQRMIEGLFVMAQGRVYPNYGDHNLIAQADLPEEFDTYLIGIDHGVQNACVFLLIGVKNGIYYVIREYSYSGRLIGVQQTNAQYLKDFIAWLGRDRVDKIFPDPNATSFNLELTRAGYPVEKADNSVGPGLQLLDNLFALRRIWVCRELRTYGWDPAALARGEEKPLKVDDDEVDALRYPIYTYQEAPDLQNGYDELFEQLLSGKLGL